MPTWAFSILRYGEHAMSKHDPSNIFVVAEQFRHASKFLNFSMLKGVCEYDVRVPMVTCSAFALELYLKSLISMERGAKPPEKHELDFLFGKLQCSSQAEVRRFFDANSVETIAFARAEHEGQRQPAPRINFDFCLKASRRAFPVSRYVYEGMPALQGWLGEVIMEGARAIILKRFPAWEGSRQISPTVVLGVLHKPPTVPTD
jgi:HEPN domain-containing protein